MDAQRMPTFDDLDLQFGIDDFEWQRSGTASPSNMSDSGSYHGSIGGWSSASDSVAPSLRSYPLGYTKSRSQSIRHLPKKLRQGYAWLKHIREDNTRVGWSPRSKAIADQRNARSFHGIEQRKPRFSLIDSPTSPIPPITKSKHPLGQIQLTTTKTETGRTQRHWRSRPEALELPSSPSSPKGHNSPPVAVAWSRLRQASSSVANGVRDTLSSLQPKPASTSPSTGPPTPGSYTAGLRVGSGGSSPLSNEDRTPPNLTPTRICPGTPTRDKILYFLEHDSCESLVDLANPSVSEGRVRRRSWSS